MTERYCEGERFADLSFTEEAFEDCHLQEIEWAPLMSNGAFPDPIHTLKECSLKYLSLIHISEPTRRS